MGPYGPIIWTHNMGHGLIWARAQGPHKFLGGGAMDHGPRPVGPYGPMTHMGPYGPIWVRMDPCNALRRPAFPYMLRGSNVLA